jgi:hypothetical protein
LSEHDDGIVAGLRCRGLAIRRDLWRCENCRRETSVMAGTIFQDSKLPLTIWFRAMWDVTTQKNGISALGLQRVLGLAATKPPGCCCTSLRRAMVRPGRERLCAILMNQTNGGSNSFEES